MKLLRGPGLALGDSPSEILGSNYFHLFSLVPKVATEVTASVIDQDSLSTFSAHHTVYTILYKCSLLKWLRAVL